VIGRAAAIAAVVVAIVAVAVIVLQGGSSYQVKAVFENASQIVSGDLVEVSGNSIGTVSNISLTPNGQAELTLSINNADYDPLRKGTLATVRQASLSGIANRYVDLRLGNAKGAPIPNNGVIPTQDTSSAVDLDQLFNTLDAPTRKALQDVIQGSASQYAGQGQKIQQAWKYLNPAIASSSVLFRELNRDTAKFTGFIVKSSNLVTHIASRRNDLAGLVQNLSKTTEALASQRNALGESIQRLPAFMALADTTFVNLRNALNKITPLVNISKQTCPTGPKCVPFKLQQLLTQLKPLAENSVPTVRDLSNIVSRPGPNNDLIELTALSPKLAAVTVGNIKTNTKGVQTCSTPTNGPGSTCRLGAFRQSTIALNQSTPELATARPYAVDLTGWFEGYTHPGGNDANGAISRIAPVIGLTSVENGLTTAIPPNTLTDPLASFLFQFLGKGAPGGKAPLVTGQGDRCPGSVERGALYYPESGFPCNPSEVPTGK
jgi:phospholipid/cholesterol/gamma-HCH transport system substrate-binding protein